jgi:hypothetical protein
LPHARSPTITTAAMRGEAFVTAPE